MLKKLKESIPTDYSKIILEEMNLSPAFSDWLATMSFESLQGKTLEIGCGIGNNLNYLNSKNVSLWGCDYRKDYLLEVEKRFSFMKGRTFLWNIEERYPQNERFDSFFCSNVIEHLQDDQLVLKNISTIPGLKSGVIIVPSIPKLHNTLDVNLGHFRRYSKKDLIAKINLSGMHVKKISYFNRIGLAGWFLQGSILKKSTLGAGNMKLYNKLMPIIRIIDPFIPIPGLSIIAHIEIKKS